MLSFASSLPSPQNMLQALARLERPVNLRPCSMVELQGAVEFAKVPLTVILDEADMHAHQWQLVRAILRKVHIKLWCMHTNSHAANYLGQFQ
jgi:hypothetical protein